MVISQGATYDQCSYIVILQRTGQVDCSEERPSLGEADAQESLYEGVRPLYVM